MAPPFQLKYSVEASKVLDDLEKPKYQAKKKKVERALRALRDIGPRHPPLNSHKLKGITGPWKRDLWDSYVENGTPAAWRIYWVFGNDDDLFIVYIGPHAY